MTDEQLKEHFQKMQQETTKWKKFDYILSV